MVILETLSGQGSLTEQENLPLEFQGWSLASLPRQLGRPLGAPMCPPVGPRRVKPSQVHQGRMTGRGEPCATPPGAACVASRSAGGGGDLQELCSLP